MVALTWDRLRKKAGVVVHLTLEAGTFTKDRCKDFPDITTPGAPGLLNKASIIPCGAADGKAAKACYWLRNLPRQRKGKDEDKDVGKK